MVNSPAGGIAADGGVVPPTGATIGISSCAVFAVLQQTLALLATAWPVQRPDRPRPFHSVKALPATRTAFSVLQKTRSRFPLDGKSLISARCHAPGVRCVASCVKRVMLASRKAEFIVSVLGKSKAKIVHSHTPLELLRCGEREQRDGL